MFKEQWGKAVAMNGPPTSRQGLKNHQNWCAKVAGSEEKAIEMIKEGNKILNQEKPANYPRQPDALEVFEPPVTNDKSIQKQVNNGQNNLTDKSD